MLRYELLLKEFAKQFSPEGCPVIEEALVSIKEVLSHVNTSKGNIEKTLIAFEAVSRFPVLEV
jgi:hypothetical protein